MNLKNFFILIAAAALLYSGCNNAGSGKTYPRFESGENEIISFSFTSQKNIGLGADATGIISGDTIEITLPHGTDTAALIADFVTNSTDVTVNDVQQTSGETPNNFSSDVDYTVTAENGDIQTYTVKVTIAPSSEKIISTFHLNGTEGEIDQSNGIITVSLPPGTSLASLTASFSAVCQKILIGDTLQISGETVNSFNDDVTYTVIADDNSSITYTVKTSVQLASWKEISAFAFNKADNGDKLRGDAAGTISESEKTISVILPYGSNISEELVASFTSTGEKVRVYNIEQTSGETGNYFSSPVDYLVTAEDGSEQTYTVTVTIAKSNARAITSFTLDGENSVIDESAGTITTEFPETKSITGLIASFVTTGTGVTVDGTNQESGVTVNDFSSNPVYRVTAEDGSFKDYTASVTRSAEIAGLWNFDYSGSDDYQIFEAVQVPGITGSALQFDGYNDYVLVPDDPALTLAKAGSIEVMIKVISHKSFAGIVHKGVRTDFEDESFSLQYWTTAGKLRFMITNDNSEQSYVDSSTVLDLDKWYHIVATWDVDSAIVRIYINGLLDCEGEITTGDVRDSHGDLVIGAQLPVQYSTTWGNLGFNGLIDRVQLLSRALTPEEISARYAVFQAEESGLTAFILRFSPADKPAIMALLLVIIALITGIALKNMLQNRKNS